MSDKEVQRDIEKAKILIQAKQYEEARALLITLNDPEADRMLNRLNELTSSGQVSTPHSGLLLLLIWLFLGLIGGHRFYTGHIAIGIIQLVTIGGFGIWWLIDGILILSGNFKDSKGNVIKL
jgi:hypothetical protein